MSEWVCKSDIDGNGVAITGLGHVRIPFFAHARARGDERSLGRTSIQGTDAHQTLAEILPAQKSDQATRRILKALDDILAILELPAFTQSTISAANSPKRG